MAIRVVPGGRVPVVGRSSMVTASSMGVIGHPGIGQTAAPRSHATKVRVRARRRHASIELEGILVVPPESRVLIFLPQEAVADGQHLDLGAHEAAEGVLRRADDGLAAHVEAGVDEDRAAGAVLEGARAARGSADWSRDARSGCAPSSRRGSPRGCPIAGRSACRCRRALRSSALMLAPAVLRARRRPAACRGCRRRARTTPPTSSRSTDGREGTEGLAILDLEVEDSSAWSGERGSPRMERLAQRARAEFHAALEPADGLFLARGRRAQPRSSAASLEHVVKMAPAAVQLVARCRPGEGGPEVGAVHRIVPGEPSRLASGR